MTKSKYIYQWADGCRVPVNPQSAGETLEGLMSRRRVESIDSLAPSDVIDEAANPQSPLHGAFEWDDTEAAIKFREEQARVLIRSIRFVVNYKTESTPVRAFVNFRPSEKLDGQSSQSVYVMTTHASKHAEAKEFMIQAARAGLAGWTARYKELAGFEKVVEQIELAIAEFDRIANEQKRSTPPRPKKSKMPAKQPAVHA